VTGRKAGNILHECGDVIILTRGVIGCKRKRDYMLE